MTKRVCFLLVLGFAPLAVRAATATGLSSFEAIEEPLVKFFPATKTFSPDGFVNITDRGDGVFRMTDRYNATWWDGDRDTQNNDRQRAEVKGLGPHQRDGETFFYSTTWRTNPEFRGTAGFCHVFQLKATNGDNGAPLVTISIHGGKATVEANPAGKKIIAREFPWKPGTWRTVRLIIRTSRSGDGALLASVDGDAFQGRTGIELSRPGADEYRPKWGLYRKATVGAPMGDDYVEHSQVRALALPADFDTKSAQPAQIVAPDDNAALEREARVRARTSSPENALAWLRTLPDAESCNVALASIAALWAETDPVTAMAWAEKFPRRAVRLDAMTRIFARWADRDVEAAATWLNRHAPDADLDGIAWLFATDTTYRYVNRRYALDGAALIKDPALRGAAFEHVVLIWARQDAIAAAAFVAETPSLDPAQKASLLKKINSRSPPASG
jgi:hypothetical protein